MTLALRHPCYQTATALVVSMVVSFLPGVVPAADAVERSKGGGHQGGGHKGSEHHDMKSAPGADAAPPDVQFLDTMIAHHQAAVDMAQLVKARSVHPELIEMAAHLFQAQRREIEQMRAWRQRWYQTQPSAQNMNLPGMKESMEGMDMEKLKQARGKDFDLLFLETMLPHHQGAVRMSEWVQEKTARRELKELAERMIRQQQREIDQMTQWKTAWTQSGRPATPQPSDLYLASSARGVDSHSATT
jgi:uncharacterized protein (DUF305 family)